MNNYRAHLMLCSGTGCVSNKAFKVKERLDKELRKHDLQDEVQVVLTGCNGFCAQGPVMVVKPGRIMFELEGVPVEIARRAMQLASAKMPMKCKFIQRNVLEG